MTRYWSLLLFIYTISILSVNCSKNGDAKESSKGKLSEVLRKGLSENATILKKHQLARSLLAADESFEDAPFWANRGRRSADEHLQNMNENPKINRNNNKERLRRMESSIEEFPFWANRGKRIKISEEDIPFWANRGKRMESEEELPFWANRGRRSISEEELPFWANRGRRNHLNEDSLEDGPFWANRGRRKRQGTLNKFYADEPKYILLNRRQEKGINNHQETSSPSSDNELLWNVRKYYQNNNLNDYGKKIVNSEEDVPFWGMRGKKNQYEETHQSKNLIKFEEGEQKLRPIPWQLATLDSLSKGYFQQNYDLH